MPRKPGQTIRLPSHNQTLMLNIAARVCEMTQRIAVAVVHGIGKQDIAFVDRIYDELQARCRKTCGDDIVIEPVHWARVIQDKEDRLWDRLIEGGPLDFRHTRRLMVDFVADALAYQPTTHDRKLYDDVHAEFARTLGRLAESAGDRAPLCVIAHSLGTIIASNFIYDLQNPALIADKVSRAAGNTPLDRGETLTLFYTLGSPLALWSLRYREFGKPVAVPSPMLAEHHPDLQGEWANFYDRDDVVAFPLRSLNDAYAQAVTRDVEVNVGGVTSSWNPLSHMHYWTDRDVVEPISQALIRAWQSVNELTGD